MFIKLNKFTGLNNVLPPESLNTTELQGARNVDIDNTGSIRRRSGFYQVYSGVCYSGFSVGDIAVFREGQSLKKLNKDMTVSTIRNGIIEELPMRYLALNGKIYYTDGVVSGVIENGSSRSWGLAVPPPPQLSVSGGNLPEIKHDSYATYQVVCTYVRDDGQESGACEPSSINLKSAGIGIKVYPSSDSTVKNIRIYITHSNGTAFYLALQVPNILAEFVYSGNSQELTYPLHTQHLSPPPAGSIIEYYSGHIFIAVDDVLYYSKPYGYELFDLEQYIQFEKPITMVASVQDGLWIGTKNEIVFLHGQVPEQFSRSFIASYGVVIGTDVKVSANNTSINKDNNYGNGIYFLSEKGVCFVFNNGWIVNVTEGRYSFNVSTQGVGTLIERNGIVQYICTLFGAENVVDNSYKWMVYGDVTMPMLFT